MRYDVVRVVVIVAAFTGWLGTAYGQAKGPTTKPAAVPLRTFTTPYYMMYTDLDDEGAREAWVRMTKMFETYKRRTAGFAGEIRERFPFYLYKNESDYLAAGGPDGSAGVYMSLGNQGKLMAIAGTRTDRGTWHTVQHEGFHQFAHAVIRGDLPVWVNEGLAEYFGEAMFTGDDFVTGLIDPGRLARVQKTIAAGKFRPLGEMMRLSHRDWNNEMSGNNYDQAWSMVHFLAHGDEGKYQQAFVKYMNLVGQGRSSEQAWVAAFGNDVAGFQAKWEAWWKAQKPDATRALYQRAVVMTLTSYLARATSQGQKFEDAQAFLEAVRKGETKFAREDWLPTYLGADAAKLADKTGAFTIERGADKAAPPTLVCVLASGADETKKEEQKLVGSFVVVGGRVSKVSVDVPTAPATVPATRPAGK